VRWDHPERGLICPEQFIGIAEEAGLIVPIGRKVLEESCHAAAAWQASDPDASPVRLAVNVSMRQLADPQLVETVRRILATSGIQPTCLSLELTEGALIEETESVYSTLEELKELGVLLALDHFGTGYSSLGYLKRLPFDVIKLDQSFVQKLGEGATDKGIVTAVVALAQTLDLSVVAEGVETAEQLAIVRALGCHYAQGHHFSPPVGADEFGRLLEAGRLVSFDTAPA
jgi:EAL domain-containing protein (putative c-di-GMP-specific phosphodiesterase class I)